MISSLACNVGFASTCAFMARFIRNQTTGQLMLERPSAARLCCRAKSLLLMLRDSSSSVQMILAVEVMACRGGIAFGLELRSVYVIHPSSVGVAEAAAAATSAKERVELCSVSKG